MKGDQQRKRTFWSLLSSASRLTEQHAGSTVGSDRWKRAAPLLRLVKHPLDSYPPQFIPTDNPALQLDSRTGIGASETRNDRIALDSLQNSNFEFKHHVQNCDLRWCVTHAYMVIIACANFIFRYLKDDIKLAIVKSFFLWRVLVNPPRHVRKHSVWSFLRPYALT